MSTILHDFFYEGKYPTHYTRLVNDYIGDCIDGLQNISYLFDIEELYNSTIDLLIEYHELNKNNEDKRRKLDFLNDRKDSINEEIDILNKADCDCVANVLAGNNRNINSYRLVSFHKRLKMETLESINRNLERADTSIRRNNRRMEHVRSSLKKLYGEIIKIYDFDALDKMFINVDQKELKGINRRLFRRVKDHDAADYITAETYKTLLDELDYLIDVYKEVEILSFDELTDEKVEELKKSKLKMNEIKEMIELKRDIIEHVFFIELSQRDKKHRDNKKTIPSKAIIDYATMYLVSSKKDESNVITERTAEHIMDVIDSTNPKEEEKKFAKRLYKPLLNKMV